MKRILILIVLIFTGVKFFAQIPVIYSDDFKDSSRVKIGGAGEFLINANALTSSFISKFYNGGYIDAELKKSVLDKTKLRNRIGGDLNYGIYAAFQPDSFLHKKNVGIFFSLRDRQHFDARYSKDFFKLGFYGNSIFAGETAYLNDFNLNFVRYQQLQIGFFSSKVDSTARLGVGLSFIKGEQYAAIYARKAELFTSEDGQYINFATQLSVAQSDTSKKGIGAFNGAGASVDIFFEAPFKTKFGEAKLSVSVADIGFIKYNRKSLFMYGDTVYHFEGFQINSIYDLQDSTFSATNKDSITNKVIPFKQQKVTYTLPSVLNITYKIQFTPKFALTEGVRYVYNANYNLLLYMKAEYLVRKNILVSVNGGWGGYGNFCYGAALGWNIGKGFILHAGSNNLEGFISPKKTAGQGAYFSLVKCIK